MAQTARPKQAPLAAPRPSASPPPSADGRRLGRRGVAILTGVLLLLNAPVLHRFLVRGEAAIRATIPYRDDFSDPATVGRNWFSTGGAWRVVDGRLLSPGAMNNPLWLEARLPADVAVEFDVRAASDEGDVKVEIFGDGTDHASGYVLIHGGWSNSLSIIARLDEHGRALETFAPGTLTPSTRLRVETRGSRVLPDRTYRWRIERRGGLLRWFVDGSPYLQFDDPHPLVGRGHDRFGFSGWRSDVSFDNLVITPL